MPTIPLDHLVDHPDNANRMPAALMEKLTRHIAESGDYPPLIVRDISSAEDEPRYQILDGHHRARALRELGCEAARCEIWEVDDERATLLLLTLNRLEGVDDPQRRGALLKRLADSVGVKELSRLVPEDPARLRKLIEASEAPPPPVEPRDVEAMPQAVTFFLTAPQRRCLLKRLKTVAKDRSEALVSLLSLDEDS
jgi:ParB-like chromosome segregation protein Spo0J